MTTVGYGDYSAQSFTEQLFMLIVQFISICSFSLIRGKTADWIRNPNLDRMIKYITEGGVIFLHQIDKRLPHVELSDFVYEDTVRYGIEEHRVVWARANRNNIYLNIVD